MDMSDEFKKRIYLEVLNRSMSSKLTQLPLNAWRIFRHIGIKHLIEGLILEDYEDYSAEELAIKYRTEVARVKYLLYGKNKKFKYKNYTNTQKSNY